MDADPQGSLTGACGLADGITPNLASVLNGNTRIAQACYPLNDRLSLLPATWALVDTESAIVSKPAYQTLLKRVLLQASGYDLILIDTAPGLSVLMLNALVTSNGVIVPCQLDAQDIRSWAMWR